MVKRKRNRPRKIAREGIAAYQRIEQPRRPRI
jgi:hypothetical protein